VTTGGPQAKSIETFLLRDVFRMDRDELNKKHILYENLFDKDAGGVSR
jgi:hypothetical protein